MISDAIKGKAKEGKHSAVHWQVVIATFQIEHKQLVFQLEKGGKEAEVLIGDPHLSKAQIEVAKVDDHSTFARGVMRSEYGADDLGVAPLPIPWQDTANLKT